MSDVIVSYWVIGVGHGHEISGPIIRSEAKMQHTQSLTVVEVFHTKELPGEDWSRVVTAEGTPAVLNKALISLETIHFLRSLSERHGTFRFLGLCNGCDRLPGDKWFSSLLLVLTGR